MSLADFSLHYDKECVFILVRPVPMKKQQDRKKDQRRQLQLEDSESEKFTQQAISGKLFFGNMQSASRLGLAIARSANGGQRALSPWQPFAFRMVSNARVYKVKKASVSRKDKDPTELALETTAQSALEAPESGQATERDVVTGSTPFPPASVNVPETDYFPGTSQFDPPIADSKETHDWSTSFHGLSTQPFPPEISEILMQPLDPEDIEIKPDGLLYLPEIKYRRILNKAFGPGGWGLAPRGEHTISQKNISREYALVCHGRFISQARGEQDFFDVSGLPTASEGCKSNALMRCCKDLGIASELWDPSFIRKFKKKHCVEVWAEHVVTKKRKKVWRMKDDTLEYPYKEVS